MTELEKDLHEYIKSLRIEYDRVFPICDGKPGVLGRMWELQKIAEDLENILSNNM